MHSIARILPVLLLASSAALASPIVGRGVCRVSPSPSSSVILTVHQTAVDCIINDTNYSADDIKTMQEKGRSTYPPAEAQNDAKAAAFEDAMRNCPCNSNRQNMPAAQFNAIPDNANAKKPSEDLPLDPKFTPSSIMPGKSANVGAGDRNGTPAEEQVGANAKSKDQGMPENESATAKANPTLMNGKIPQGQRQSGAPKVGADESEGQRGMNGNARVTPSGEHTSSDLTMDKLPSNFGESANIGEPSSQRASTTHDSAKVTESNPNGMPESANAKSSGANPSMSTESDPEGMESAGANADYDDATVENGKKTQVGESESAPQGMPAKENESAKVTPADQHQGSNGNAKAESGTPKFNESGAPNENAKVDESEAPKVDESGAPNGNAEVDESEAPKVDESGAPNGNAEVHESGAPKVNGSTERQGASPKENAEVGTTGHRQTSPNANLEADESGAPGTQKVNSPPVMGLLEKGAGQTCTCA